MFTSTELYKRQDMSKVQRCMEALSKIAPKFGSTVPPIDASQRAPPKKVALTEEAAQQDSGPTEKELEDKVAGVKKNCQTLREEEESLRAAIVEEKRAWRDEKTLLVYAVSAAEKEFGKQGQTVPVRDESTRHLEEMKEHVRKATHDAEEALKAEQERRARVQGQIDDLLKEEAFLVAELRELEDRIRVVPPPPPPEPVKYVLPSCSFESFSRDSRYTKLSDDYFFYETAVTSPDMIGYLTAQLQKLLVNVEVSFEDLFKLKELFETDEGRRVFCFILFQTIEQTKKSSKDKGGHHILTSDSFDLVLWLMNTVLQCQDKFDFFGARVLMKSSFYLAREIGGKKLETIQQFVRSDPLWRNLAFWQELFTGDLNAALKKKKGSQASKDSSPLTSRELSIALKFAQEMVTSMAVDWRLPASLQEAFALSVSEQLGISTSDRDKVRNGLVID